MEDEIEEVPKLNKNEATVAHIMTAGALHQGFVLSALAEYARMIIAAPIPDTKDRQIIPMKEWKKVAVDVRTILIENGYFEEEPK